MCLPEKHQFPYVDQFFTPREKSIHQLVPESQKSHQGHEFNMIWKQWGGNLAKITDILHHLYRDTFIKTVSVDSGTMKFVEVEHQGVLRLILAIPDQGKSRADKRPVDAFLSSYALSTVMERPEVFELSLLAVLDDRTYLPGKILNKLYLGPILEYAKSSAPLLTKSDDQITQLWNVINFRGHAQQPFIETWMGDKKFRLHRCLGSGFSGTVYEASLPNEQERKVIKIIKLMDDREAFTIEKLQRETQLESVKDMQLTEAKGYINTEGRYIVTDLIVMPLGKLIFPTSYLPKEYMGTMKLEHFKEILEEIKMIHKTGMVHRDVRLENIVIWKDKAHLIDFGSCCREGVACTCAGTRCTASQRCLQIYVTKYHGNVEFEPRDDLESLFKTFILWSHPTDSPTTELGVTMMVGASLPFMHHMLHYIWESWVTPIAKMNYAQLEAFLSDFFSIDLD